MLLLVEILFWFIQKVLSYLIKLLWYLYCPLKILTLTFSFNVQLKQKTKMYPKGCLRKSQVSEHFTRHQASQNIPDIHEPTRRGVMKVQLCLHSLTFNNKGFRVSCLILHACSYHIGLFSIVKESVVNACLMHITYMSSRVFKVYLSRILDMPRDA